MEQRAVERVTIANAVTRRRFLAGCGGGLAGALLAGRAPALVRAAGASTPRKIRLALPWLFIGGHAFEFVAQQEGWKKRGLDVEILRGSGSGAAVKSVATGQTEFAEASVSVAVKGVADGLDVVAIAAKLQKSPVGISCVGDVKDPRDVQHRRIVMTAAGGERVLFPGFVRSLGLDESKLDMVIVAPDKLVSTYLAGQADCSGIYLVSNGAVIQIRKPGTRTFLYADFGLDSLDLGFLATSKTVKGEPQLCRDFVDGALEGLKVQLLEPERALEVMKRARPELQREAPELLLQQLGNTNYLALGPAAEQHGLGYMSPELQEQTRNVIIKYFDAKDLPPASRLFTNEFAGRITLTAPEWAQAKTFAQRFAPKG